MLQLRAPPNADLPQDPVVPPRESSSVEPIPSVEPLICPHCHQGRLIFSRMLSPRQAMAP